MIHPEMDEYCWKLNQNEFMEEFAVG